MRNKSLKTTLVLFGVLTVPVNAVHGGESLQDTQDIIRRCKELQQQCRELSVSTRATIRIEALLSGKPQEYFDEQIRNLRDKIERLKGLTAGGGVRVTTARVGAFAQGQDKLDPNFKEAITAKSADDKSCDNYWEVQSPKETATEQERREAEEAEQRQQQEARVARQREIKEAPRLAEKLKTALDQGMPDQHTAVLAIQLVGAQHALLEETSETPVAEGDPDKLPDIPGKLLREEAEIRAREMVPGAYTNIDKCLRDYYRALTVLLKDMNLINQDAFNTLFEWWRLVRNSRVNRLKARFALIDKIRKELLTSVDLAATPKVKVVEVLAHNGSLRERAKALEKTDKQLLIEQEGRLNQEIGYNDTIITKRYREVMQQQLTGSQSFASLSETVSLSS